MTLRTRIALLVGVTVLIASAVGGIGAAVSSRNVGRDRVDEELVADATRFPPDAARLAGQLQFTFEARRSACEDTTDGEAPGATTDATRRETIAERLRFLPEFASSIQLIRPNGNAVAACQTLPVDDAELAIARAGTGTAFRTVAIDGERFRVLTMGYGDVGAVQFARSLAITEDTLRGLLVRVFGFGLIGAVIAGLLGFLFAKRATEPVKRLSEAAERVARTRDLGERIDVAGDDEIGALAASFNTMLASLDTSREQQQRLVQDASHELRTPLTSMRTNVELLQRHTGIELEMRNEVLADINAELAELSELTAELVESATEVPTQLHASTTVDLVEVVTDCVERARRRHRRTIELSVRDDPRTIVAGDVGLLGRAVMNLLNNAVKFSDPTTGVEVEVSGSSVVVSDRGPGLAEADLPHIFDRFYRSTTARAAPGSGLGLAIVKQIVEGHGGWVNASNRQGGGATIGFSLPPGTAEVD